MTTQPDHPDVSIVSVAEATGRLVALYGLLSEAERAEVRRFVREDDRRRFVLARGTLRERAGAALGVDPARLVFLRDALGKPTLPDHPGLAFNVSHAGDLVAVALAAEGEIGIDVERHRPRLDVTALAPVIFTDFECRALAAAAPAERTDVFFRSWVFKEAVVKAAGTGLSLDPRRFEVDFRDARPVLRFVGRGPDDLGSDWRLAPIPVPAGYSAALAVRPRPRLAAVA